MTIRTLPHLQYLGFQLIQPAPELREFVQDYWFVQSHDTTLYREEFLHPTGGVGIILNYGDVFSLDNQLVTAKMCLDGANTFSRRLNFAGHVNAVGVRFKTAGAYPFFKMPIFEIIDHPYDLLDLQIPHIHNIYEQVYEATSIYKQAQLLNNWLLHLLNTNRIADATVQGAIQHLQQSHGIKSVQAIGDQIGISTRQLQRQYKTQIGISPKHYARLLRVDHVRTVIKTQANPSFADVACQTGYYDQSHLIREFKSVVGMTPGAYVERHLQRNDYSATNAETSHT